MEMMVRQFDLCSRMGRPHAGVVLLEKGLLFAVRPLQMATPCIHETLCVSTKTVKMEENPHLLLGTTRFMFIPTGLLRKLTTDSRSKRGAYSSSSKKQCNIFIPPHALYKRQ
ncbi:hypothetical protein CY35_15G106600 [Sphagnum magellanicum]|nr:hypothetical protein CY35_15G106600 [Sphagnum magellanicum]